MLAGLEKILEEAHALHEGFEQFLLEHCPDVDDILSVSKTLTQGIAEVKRIIPLFN